MAKILVTDGNYSHSLGIIKSLNKLGHTIDCIGHPLCLSTFSRSLNKVSFKQTFFNSQYIDKFLEFLEKENYDFLIPVGANSVSLVNQFRDRISKRVIINIAPSESINNCLNKEKLIQIAKDNNIPLPKTYSKNEIFKNSFKKDSYSRKFVLKPSSELSNSRVLYISSINKLRSIVNSKDGFLVQDFISGYGVGFFAIYDNGTLKSFFMHKRIRENPPSGGSSVCAESIFDENLFFYGKKILDKLNWHGVAMVEFKKEYITGKLFLMEVNPKFWASHDLAIASGLNFASEYLLIKPNNKSTNKIDNFKIEYNLNIKYQWLARDLSSSVFRPIRLLKVLYYFLILRSYNNLNIDDPICSLYLIIYAFFAPFAKLKIFKKIYTFMYRIKKFGFDIAFQRLISEYLGICLVKYSKINNLISIGASPSQFGLYILERKNFEYILNLRMNKKLTSKNKFLKVLNIPVLEYSSPTVSQLSEGADFINEAIKNNKKIYIFCREGVSRAPTFLIAYLIKYQNESFKTALNIISETRPFVNILHCQRETILEFENLKDY